MPTRSELISAGFAGLAGILDSSSEEDDTGDNARPALRGALEGHAVTKQYKADKTPLTLRQGDTGGHSPMPGRHMETSDMVGDILADLSSSRFDAENATRRSGAQAESQARLRSLKPESERESEPSALVHGTGALHGDVKGAPNPSILPRPRMSTSGPLSVQNDAPERQHDPMTEGLPTRTLPSEDQRITDPSAASALPQTAPGRQGNSTPASARLPIFDSDSEDGLPSPQSVKGSGAKVLDSLPNLDGNSSGPTTKPSLDHVKIRSQTPKNDQMKSVGAIDSGLLATGHGASVQGSTGVSGDKLPTQVYRSRGCAQDATKGHGPSGRSEDVAVSFGLTDEMLLPLSHNDDCDLHPSARLQHAGVTAEPSPMPIAQTASPTRRDGQQMCEAKAALPRALPGPAPREHSRREGAHDVPVAANGQVQISAALRNQPGSMRVLRSITTPAEQLRLKDEQILALSARVDVLEKQVNGHQNEIATKVAAAVEATRSSTVNEHERLQAALERANQDVASAKDITARREAALQKQLRELQLAASSAADDAAAEVARVRDQAARDIRDADSRARLRIDAELAGQKVQLEAEAAALKEERSLLDRNRQSAEILSSLSARVEVASAAAIQREERLASRLDSDLQERERRCQQREVAVSQREAAVASAEQDGDVLRKQLLELSAKAQAAASQDAVAAADDRRRLQHEAARLDAAVNALEQQRQEIAAGIDMERSTLQATRAARDEERQRFMQEVTEERRRLAEERTIAWAEMDRIHNEAAKAQSKVVQLEAQSAAALLETSKSRDAKAALDMEMQQTRAELRMKQQRLEADQAAVESERQLLLHDTQMLHDSTQQLRQLRGSVAKEKEVLLDTVRKLDDERAEFQGTQAAAAAQIAAVATAEKQIGEMRIKLSEKRAQLSNEMVKHGRVQAAWHTLREQIQQQLCTWSVEHHNMPSFSCLWNILVCTEEGHTIKAVSLPPHTSQQHAQLADVHSASRNHTETESHPAAGKENYEKAQLSFLTQKLSVLDSIISKRRSLPQQQDINTKFMAELGKRHRELGISETLAWGRQIQMPGFPVQGGGPAGAQSNPIQHPSPMHTPYRTQNLHNVSVPPAQVPSSFAHPVPASGAGWKHAAVVATAEASQQFEAGPSHRASSLPSGFVPLQPVSTTEDSFSYRGSLERSRASKRQSPCTSHNVESATSQDHMSQDHQESPGTESCQNQGGNRVA